MQISAPQSVTGSLKQSNLPVQVYDLCVGLHELWSRPEPGSGQMLIGFRIIDIASDDKLRLRRWVIEPGSEYV